MKIKMLLHTFCTFSPGIQQKKPSSGVKEIYSTKLKSFCSILQKLREPIALRHKTLSYEKNRYMVLHE